MSQVTAILVDIGVVRADLSAANASFAQDIVSVLPSCSRGFGMPSDRVRGKDYDENLNNCLRGASASSSTLVES